MLPVFFSVGKSTLLTMLTGTHSEAASYEFTTLTCIPGIIHYNDTKIQLLDLPGIIEGASEGKGRGRQVNSLLFLFNCDNLSLFDYLANDIYINFSTVSCYDFEICPQSILIVSCYISSNGHKLTQLCLLQVIAVAKSSDIVLMVLDASKVSIFFVTTVLWKLVLVL